MSDPGWRKSSYSGGGNCVECKPTQGTGWRKPSRSVGNGACLEWQTSSHSANGHCVQVATPGQYVLVRDSKNPDGGVLEFPAATWQAFVDSLKR